MLTDFFDSGLFSLLQVILIMAGHSTEIINMTSSWYSDSKCLFKYHNMCYSEIKPRFFVDRKQYIILMFG